MKDIISRDGYAIAKGQRVAYSDASGFLFGGEVVALKFGLVHIRDDRGFVTIRGGSDIYVR